MQKLVTDYDREVGSAQVRFFFPDSHFPDGLQKDPGERHHSYALDIVGNWIKRTAYRKYNYPEKHLSPEEVIYRTITYYEGVTK